jgi:hypothetical protein
MIFNDDRAAQRGEMRRAATMFQDKILFPFFSPFSFRIRVFFEIHFFDRTQI